MVHAIHLISVLVLLGAIVSVRFIVIPSAQTLGGDSATQMLGAAMIRVRRIVWLSLAFSYFSGAFAIPFNEIMSNPYWLLKLGLAAVFLVVAVFFVVSPQRRIWLISLEHRRGLLDILLVLGLAIIALSELLARQ